VKKLLLRYDDDDKYDDDDDDDDGNVNDVDDDDGLMMMMMHDDFDDDGNYAYDDYLFPPIFCRKCDVNTADGEGTTSLHYCSEYNRPDMIK